MADPDDDDEEDRGPGGSGWRKDRERIKKRDAPEQIPDWMRASPDWRQELDPNKLVDIRHITNYQGRPFLRGNAVQLEPQARAMLKVLRMGANQYYDPDEGMHYPNMPVSPMARELGLADINQQYDPRTAPFRMPNQSREEYLKDIAASDAPKGSIADDRKTNAERLKERQAEEMAKAAIDGTLPVPTGFDPGKLPGIEIEED